MTSSTGSMHGGFWGIWKKSVELSLAVRRRRRLTFASSQWPCGGCHTCLWGEVDGKASIERLCLSPYVKKPLNSKVIKSFVPELRSRKCFSCFRITMFYVTYEHYMYVSYIRIWLWYTWPGIEPSFPGPLAITLPTRPMSRLKPYYCVQIIGIG